MLLMRRFAVRQRPEWKTQHVNPWKGEYTVLIWIPMGEQCRRFPYFMGEIIQELFLGKEKVSLLKRCLLHIRGVWL